MKVCDILTEYIDNVRGKGAVPFNQEVDYMGLRVNMAPSVFLKLARELPRDRAEAVDFIKDHMQSGGAIGAPFLFVNIPDSWRKGDLTEHAAVHSHDGRNRMYAIQEMHGDAPVEVHLFLRNGYRNRDMTPDMKSALADSMIPEQGSAPITGPLFTL